MFVDYLNYGLELLYKRKFDLALRYPIRQLKIELNEIVNCDIGKISLTVSKQ